MKSLPIIFSLLSVTSFICAQGIHEQISQKKDYYQIFLDSPVQKVNNLIYFDDENTPIEFKLSPDGKSIHMLDYKGTGGVKAEVVNMEGAIEEVIRSQCKIHSLQEL